MKKYLAMMVAIIIVISFISGCGKKEVSDTTRNNPKSTTKSDNSQSTNIHPVVQSNSTQGTNPNSRFQKAPDFSLPSIDGKIVRLSDYEGKVVILDFWATWCRPCVMEMPSFVQLMKKYSGQPFAVIGVDLDRRVSKEGIKSFLKSHNINYTIVMGMSERSVLERFGGIPAIPTAFIIDKNGYIRQKLVGYHQLDVFDSIVKTLLEEELAERE